MITSPALNCPVLATPDTDGSTLPNGSVLEPIHAIGGFPSAGTPLYTNRPVPGVPAWIRTSDRTPGSSHPPAHDPAFPGVVTCSPAGRRRRSHQIPVEIQYITRFHVQGAEPFAACPGRRTEIPVGVGVKLDLRLGADGQVLENHVV